MNPSSLATVDHATGAATVLGGTGVAGGGKTLAFSKGLVLYHTWTSSPTTFVSTLNQASGVASPGDPAAYAGFPPPAFLFVPNAMDAHPSTGVMYVSVNDSLGGAGPVHLATFDPATNSFRYIGITASDLDALAWEPDRCRVALYGAGTSGSFNSPSTLYRIDSNTGAAAPIGPINFNAVGGMEVNPVTGRMFGTGKRPVGGTHVLIVIDPTTGAGSEIGPLVNAGLPTIGGSFGLSFRSDGTLFLVAFEPTNTSVNLFVVDQTTGTATLIGDTGGIAPGNALGHSLSNVLYHINVAVSPTSQLRTTNESTGASSFLSLLAYAGFPALASPRINAMDTDPSTGAAWAIVNAGGGGAGPHYLATVDPRLGIVRHIGPTTPGMDALTFAAICNDGDPCTFDECVRCQDSSLLGAAFVGPNGLADLYRIDPTSGAAALIGPIGFERVSGIEYDRETGVLYATGERADGTNTNVLIAIDPATGAGNEIGPTGIAGFGFATEPDIAQRDSDGGIYAYLDLGDGVATIDRVTGGATFLGLSGIGGFGNGLAFSTAGDLYLADGTNVDTLDQTTGVATPVAPLAYSGFPPPIGNYRVNAIDGNCDGRFFVTVMDTSAGGGGPTYLGVLDPVTGKVGHIGLTTTGMDALTWTGVRGFCRNTFVDSDLDTVCDAFDCAALDPSAWTIPPEITTDTMANAFDYVWGSLAPISGPGTVYDLAADTVTALPVGPMEPPLFFVCSAPHVPIGVGDPPVGQIWWVVVRGRNVCGAGTYGYEQHNNLPPFPLFIQRNTASCP